MTDGVIADGTLGVVETSRDGVSSRTLGVDLAAANANTAACVIEWAPGGSRIATLRPGAVADDDIVALANGVSVTGIDAPFGWPSAFSDAVAAWAAGGPWTAGRGDDVWFRATDLHARAVTGGRPPLSVSSDRIARPAVRAAILLGRLGRNGRPAARDGADRVIEVYPAGAMRCWGLTAAGYKAPAALDIRASLADVILAISGVDASADQRADLAATDHALDALVAALVARAFDRGLVVGPGQHAEAARREGWLYLPSGSLGALSS